MTRPTRARPVLRNGRFNTVVFTAAFFLLACSNSSSNSDGGTGGSTGSGGGSGGASGVGGGGGDKGVGGSYGGSPGTGGTAGAPGTGGQGATGGAGGHDTPCGSGETCSTGQICVRPGCGGGVAVCEKLPDGGRCPSGWTYTGNCATGVGPGCIPPPCTPPPQFCADLPAACSGTPSCLCIPTNLCQQNGGTGSCQSVSSTEVMCGSA